MAEQSSKVAAEAPLRLSTPVGELPGVGARRVTQLRRLGVATVSDLLRHYPTRYERLWAEGTIRDLPMTGIGSARGTVVNTRWVTTGRQRFQATVQDHSDRLSLVWFNGRWLRDKLHPGMVIRVQGKVRAYQGYPQMVNPRWEALDEPEKTAAGDERLRPVYPSTEDLPSATIEQIIAEALPAALPLVIDPLPTQFVRDRRMPPLAEAFAMIHQPADPDQWKSARRRLAYNELLLLQLGIALRRQYTRTMCQAPALHWSKAIDEHIRQRFPFALTPSQAKVVGEIAADLAQDRPMNRLLQGDVGAGKTVVALYALLMAVADRRQGAMMAPTELLAEQHFASIGQMLHGSNVRIELLTGGQSAAGSAARAKLMRDVAAGKVDIVVGTSALLTERVRFKDLAVVVVDEQHRFGVTQRAAFRNRAAGDTGEAKGKAGGAKTKGGALKHKGGAGKAAADDRVSAPHCLVMTATPIPRTLSLTVFGDLDISTIDGLPPGRSPITTRLVGQDKSDEVYRYMAGRLARGEQAYVVVPTIDASGNESAQQLKSVGAHVKLLEDKYCRDHKVAAIHGRLKRATRDAVMQRFRRGDVHVLVATTVIEVGVDVPNASVMIVEHAERFGLAQLHQLRGRIGRGTHGRKSLCVLIAEPTTDEAAKRLEAIASTTDGFKIAERDLAIRGMGDFFGTRQHGLPPLRLANIPDDMDLLQMARRDAGGIAEHDPHLDDPAYHRLRKVLVQQYGDALGLIDVG